jgi:hypothetical protein
MPSLGEEPGRVPPRRTAAAGARTAPRRKPEAGGVAVAEALAPRLDGEPAADLGTAVEGPATGE